MKRIKAFALLLGVVVLASCASQKRVIYLQDTQADEQVKIAQDYQIRIKPLDRLTVVVNSRDPELAAPFNTSTSLNSLTGTPLSTYSSNSASLQIRTVDENGDLDMPIIGPIQCKGKTRSELAQEIADKIREGVDQNSNKDISFRCIKQELDIVPGNDDHKDQNNKAHGSGGESSDYHREHATEVGKLNGR